MEAYDFKFKWLNEEGHPQGFLSKKGSFDGETLVLDEAQIPCAAILGVEHRQRRVLVSIPGEEGQAVSLLFILTKGNGDRLKQLLGRARSAAWAKHHKEELAAKGRGSEYRDVTCPHCQALIDLSGMVSTPQVSCDFCQAVFSADAALGAVAKKHEKQYRLCDECGMFSKPRRFTIFYFYFLLVVYGFSHRQTWRCPGCMRGEAWKMLFGNLIFVLGVPVAIAQLVRAYGGTDVGGVYPGLDSANVKARSGKFEQAVDDYRKILEREPVAAGVKYNIALAFVRREDWEGAAKMCEFALADCANYMPAVRALAGCYEQLGADEKLAQLKRQWGAAEEEAETLAG